MSAQPDCWFLKVYLLLHSLSVPHEQALSVGILRTELSAWQGLTRTQSSSSAFPAMILGFTILGEIFSYDHFLI